MVDDLVQKLYANNRSMIIETERIIYFLRIQEFDRAFGKITKLVDSFQNLFGFLEQQSDYLREKGISYDLELYQLTLQDLFMAQNEKDYVLLADLYEVKLIPLLFQLQEIILPYKRDGFSMERYVQNINKLLVTEPDLAKLLDTDYPENFAEAGYSVEPTSVGDMTLAIENGNRKCYVHSNINVWKEAALLARSWYNKEKDSYIIYGLGLGFHIRELLLIDADLDIEIYESDLNIIRLCCMYTENIKAFYNRQAKLIYDPDFSKLAARIEHIDDNTEFIIHHPSLQTLSDSPVKEKLENYFIQYSTIKNQLPLLNGNFRKNISHYDGTVDDLREYFHAKPLYIVAAGPSLDKNFLQLKKIGKEGIILATGTVFKKLMNAGIKPDFVLVTDPNARVYKQIIEFEDCDVPMIFLSTAYYRFAANYKGKKYLVCQKDFRKAEEYAKKHGLGLFQTGGSVSTTALDIGITLGCSRIIFLGLDLAYTDNYAHASDTSRRNATQIQDMRQVEDIHGNQITTSRSLDMFRIWIENRIRDVKGIDFIDATEGGAKIKGLRIAKLTDVLEEC